MRANYRLTVSINFYSTRCAVAKCQGISVTVASLSRTLFVRSNSRCIVPRIKIVRLDPLGRLDSSDDITRRDRRFYSLANIFARGEPTTNRLRGTITSLRQLRSSAVRRRPAMRRRRRAFEARQPSSVDNRSSSNEVRHVTTDTVHHGRVYAPREIQRSRTGRPNAIITIKRMSSRMSKYILSAAKCRVHFPN